MNTALFRVPQEDGTVAAWPPDGDFARLVEFNRNLFRHSRVEIDGVPLERFRQAAREEVFRLAADYFAASGEPFPTIADAPILAAGHQPEFFHPGVWIKNFAISGLSQLHRLQPLNLIVDNDLTKGASLNFPQRGNSPEETSLTAIPFDHSVSDAAFEARPIVDATFFAAFPERAAAVTRHWSFEPLLNEAWPNAIEASTKTPLLGECMVRVRRHWERRWGCHNPEVPLSRICDGLTFRRFAAKVIDDLPRFHEVHNGAIQEYRTQHKLRSRNHPVPFLERDGDWLEAPFWVPLQDGRRGRPFVLNAGGKQRIRVGDRIFDEPPTLRTRALTTTLFTRLCFAETFMHGIGGAKYDAVTDAIIREWLNMEAPRYAVRTATLRLPFVPFAIDPSAIADSQRAERDAHWNPQRFQLEQHPLARQRLQLAAAKPEGKSARRNWFRQLRELHGQLLSATGDRSAEFADAAAKAKLTTEANEIIRRRDFAWLLYPEELLRPFLQKMLTFDGS